MPSPATLPDPTLPVAAARRIELLCIDVDGTLTPGDNYLAPETRRALHDAAAAGLGLLIATGRRYRTTRRMIDAIGLPLSAVCLGGALTKDRTGATLARQAFTPTDVAAAVALARYRGLTTVLQHDGPIDTGPDFLIDTHHDWHPATAHYASISASMCEHGDALATAHWRETLAISMYDDEAKIRAFLADLAREHPGRFATLTVPAGITRAHYGEVLQPQVNKWSGILPLMAAQGLTAANVCTVGDQANDLPMIASAGLGVAMGNAAPAVQAAAGWTTRSAAEHGVAWLIDNLLAVRNQAR